MEYSDNLLRGLSAEEWVRDGLVTAAAFQIKFEKPFIKGECAAQSICWEDDTYVIDMMLQQKKDDNFQFKEGIAKLSRGSVDNISRLQSFRGILSYERDPLPDNKYHGNLLVRHESSKTQRKLLPAVMASNVSEIIQRD